MIYFLCIFTCLGKCFLCEAITLQPTSILRQTACKHLISYPSSKLDFFLTESGIIYGTNHLQSHETNLKYLINNHKTPQPHLKGFSCISSTFQTNTGNKVCEEYRLPPNNKPTNLFVIRQVLFCFSYNFFGSFFFFVFFV